MTTLEGRGATGPVSVVLSVVPRRELKATLVRLLSLLCNPKPAAELMALPQAPSADSHGQPRLPGDAP